jgi:hypothetical protein
MLQRAWRLHGRQWIEDHGQRRALNVGYVTTSVPVPLGELAQALLQAMLVE